MQGVGLMAVDYENSARCWKKNKAALIRAQKAKDWRKVIAVCDQAFSDFEDYGYPDAWHLFERARHDALIAAQYA
jgi:hypothetical protein